LPERQITKELEFQCDQISDDTHGQGANAKRRATNEIQYGTHHKSRTHIYAVRKRQDPVQQDKQDPVWPENKNVVRPGHDLQ
jgi:hypothetical protein